MSNNNNNNWKRIGGYSRTGTQNFVRTNDAAMGGTTFGSTDVSYNTGNLTQRIGNNAGVIFINGDIDMIGGNGVGAPINRIKNVRDPSDNQDVVTKYYVDKAVLAIQQQQQNVGPRGPEGPPGIGDAGQNGSDGSTGPTGVTGPVGPRGATEGVVGPTGANGAIGATGSNGAAGATGAIGPVGAPGVQGTQGNQGIQGSNGTILWLNPDGDSINNELITDSYMLSKVPIQSSVRTIGPISVSATYGNTNKMIPSSRFWNTAKEISSSLAVIPSGVWVLNIYAAVPSNSDANQVSIYAAIFMITGTNNQPSPDSLIIETKDGGDAGYYPPRAEYLPDHVKYIGRSWEATATTTNTQNALTTTATGVLVTSTAKNLYKIQMPVDFVTMKDASGNSENVYIQLQIYVKNTKTANQTANVLLYYQTNLSTSETTYSYLQTTFGAVGSIGPVGKTGPGGSQGLEGSKGETGPYGQIGPVGPTGNTGARGPAGPQGATGPTGPAGQSTAFGPQYSVQYRSNTAPQGVNDLSGSFGGTTNFRYDSGGFSTNASDASMGTVVMNDLACKSIHSSFYVEDPSITGTGSTRPRTFVKGGEPGGSYVVLASGKDTLTGGTTSSPATAADITHGIKLVHNIDGSPPTATINLHNGIKTPGTIGMKFDLTTGNVTTAGEQFCVLNSSGRVGVGGISAGEMSAVLQSDLDRALHVCGNVMIGTHPATSRTKTASSAMIMLNEATSAPTTKDYPGVYHRNITGATTTLGLQDASGGGLGLTSPNFITFQTGNGATQSNSIVIDVSGTVSMTGRTNLNGPVSVGKNFADTSSHGAVSIKSTLDISGTTHMSSVTTSYTDNPRLKLISNSINLNSDIPSLSQSANEISGVNSTENSGFLRLSAQTPGNSCIDLTGINTHATGRRYNNSVRIVTGGTERMIIDGIGNIGVGTTTPGVRLDVVGASSVAAARITSTATTGIAITTTGRVGVNNAAPTVDLDVTGSAKITGNIDMSSTGRINNLVNPSAAQDAATKVYVDTITADIATTTATNTSITNALNTGTMVNNPTITENGSSSSNQRLVYTATSTGRATLNNDADLYYNPSSNTLYAGNVDVTGNSILRNAVRVGSSVAPTVALDVTGSAKITGNLNMSSTGRINNLVDPSSTQDAATKNYVDTSIPVGGIIMWSGVGVSLPSNWKLCDGTVYNGITTPDLRKRAVISSGYSLTTGTIPPYILSTISPISITSAGSAMVAPPGALQTTYGAPWGAFGQSIPGGATDKQSGLSVSLSSDGTIMAVGAPYGDSATGITRIYKYSSGSWGNFGQAIPGDAANEQSGFSVSLSSDGTIVAIGAYNANTGTGITRIYKYSSASSTWEPFGQSIPGGATGENSGFSVSLSSDGTIVAIGAYCASGQTGITRIYKYYSGSWGILGAGITGVTTGDRSGYSVSLSSDGTIVAIGSPTGRGDGPGTTRTYKYSSVSSSWGIIGGGILSGATEYQSGFSVSLSSDGTVVAIGAPYYNTMIGMTRVYTIPTTNAITYTSGNSSVADIFGNILLIKGPGTSNIVATQSGTITNGTLTVSGTTYTLVYISSSYYVLAFIMRIS